ncbi:MAG: UvrB/UvrC motif-containing protein, partial [Bacillales bacterium]|nr:UvrB/UvrC motif-containing protein [Bacillales bacterium]
IPEVSLIAILDADKEGFLRSSRSLIQIIGRAARNKNGQVIMYADKITDSMKEAIDETNRRRLIQEQYNEEYGIIPETIIKEIHEPIKNTDSSSGIKKKIDKNSSRSELEREIKRLESEMKSAAKQFDFERAAEIRDIIFEIKSQFNK